MFGIKGWADAAVIGRYAHHWIAIGQAGRFFRLARAEQCRDVLFIGTVLRPPITQLRLDWQTIRAMPGLIRAYRGGDDKLISGVARIAERGGLRVVGVKDVAPEVLVPEGVLGRYRPSDRDQADIARALDVIAALGPFDVGQAAVVADNNVLGVEAAEGTDNLLNRIAELRRIGRVTAAPGTGVLVKAPKPGQDRRLDLALDRSAYGRECRARRACRSRRHRRLDNDRGTRRSHRGGRSRRNFSRRRPRGRRAMNDARQSSPHVRSRFISSRRRRPATRSARRWRKRCSSKKPAR